MELFNLVPIAFIDPPQVLTTSVTPIPGSGSSPLQIISTTGLKTIYAIDYADNTGDFIGVYLGASGQEVLKCVIGGGYISRTQVVIPPQSRVSLRAMAASSITNGMIMMTFMGNMGLF
jgi:hypothetical protein